MSPLKIALLAWLYAMAVYSAGVNYGAGAGWALFFAGALAVVVFCVVRFLDDRPGQVERLEARDQSEALEACRQVLAPLRPLFRYELEGQSTEISITMCVEPVAVVRLDDLRRALKALGVSV